MDFNKALFGFIKVAFTIMVILLIVFGAVKSVLSDMILDIVYLRNLLYPNSLEPIFLLM